MPTARSLIAGLALAFTAISCTDKGPTAPDNSNPANPSNNAPSMAKAKPTTNGLGKTFTNLPITQVSTGATGTFTGALTITSLATNSAGQLLASGTLAGQQTLNGVTTTVSETFSNVVVGTDPQHCTILHLDVGPIFLDLLGLQVTTNEIVLDVTAVAGPGNLLGNLLCALVHLLDQNPLSTLVGNLLAQINAILASL
jgi:hypothetical protein